MCQIAFYYKLETQSKKKGLNHTDIEICENVMKAGGKRNKDAWGWFSKHEAYKQPGAFKASDTIKVKKQTPYLVMHNRLATSLFRGDKNNMRNINNHPFEAEGLYLAHNGQVFGDNQLRDLWDGANEDISTDSYAILCAIQRYTREHGITQSIKKACSHIYESAALSTIVGKRGSDYIYYFRTYSPEMRFYLLSYDNGKEKALAGLGGLTSESSCFTYQEYGMEISLQIHSKMAPSNKTLYRLGPKGVEYEKRLAFRTSGVRYKEDLPVLKRRRKGSITTTLARPEVLEGWRRQMRGEIYGIFD
jgi:predicted glutamine amidotransferase